MYCNSHGFLLGKKQFPNVSIFLLHLLIIIFTTYALVSSDDRCVVTTERHRPSKKRANRKIPDVCNDFAQIFEVNEIDVKSLHNTGPLFRYQVMQNSVLLYGRNYDYLTFKSYAFRDYHDSKDLFRLKEVLIRKRMQSFNLQP